MQEKLLDSELFGNHAIGITVYVGTLIEHGLIHLLDFRLIDGLIALSTMPLLQ